MQKPKPTKADRKPLVKSLPLKKRKVAKEGFISLAKRRKNAEKQLESLTKMIISWRDGQECVMKGRGKCGNGMMWNHLIAQKKSPWLRYDLGNVHWGCGTHNLEDHHGSSVFPSWFISVFGGSAFMALDCERQKHVGQLPTVTELEDMVKHYEELFQNRFYVELNIDHLIKAGYYGEVLKGFFYANTEL